MPTDVGPTETTDGAITKEYKDYFVGMKNQIVNIILRMVHRNQKTVKKMPSSAVKHEWHPYYSGPHLYSTFSQKWPLDFEYSKTPSAFTFSILFAILTH